MSDYNAFRRRRHFAALDGLRCLSIAMVLWHHAPGLGIISHPVVLLRRGFTGVDFFFVLSGFLITTLLLREEERDGSFSLESFYWRRAPPYFLVVTAISAYEIVVKGRTSALEILHYYYLFLSNFLVQDIPLLSITWSLSIEEQFYLFWPTLMLLTVRRTRSRVGLLVGLIALNVAAISGVLAPLGVGPIAAGPLRLWLPAATYAPLLIGALLAIVLHTPRGFGILHRLLAGRAVPAVCFLALIAALQWLPGDLRGWPNLVLHGLMAACIAALVVREDNDLAPVLAFPLVARIGVVSYGIYLYHHVARHIASEGLAAAGLSGDLHAWATTVAYMPLSFLLAEISYRTFEKVFRGMRHQSPRRLLAAIVEAPRRPEEAVSLSRAGDRRLPALAAGATSPRARGTTRRFSDGLPQP